MNPLKEFNIHRIVSGGQTGVDRGALDAAISLGMEHGGWCPRGRLAEDGQVPDIYELVETDSPDYPVRTEQNVIDSDATLILYRNRVSGGTNFTYRMAKKHKRPYLLIDLDNGQDVDGVRAWLLANGVSVLNVAGPRESSSVGIGREAREFLLAVLREDEGTSSFAFR